MKIRAHSSDMIKCVKIRVEEYDAICGEVRNKIVTGCTRVRDISDVSEKSVK